VDANVESQDDLRRFYIGTGKVLEQLQKSVKNFTPKTRYWTNAKKICVPKTNLPQQNANNYSLKFENMPRHH
jgi:hypothetical protein